MHSCHVSFIKISFGTSMFDIENFVLPLGKIGNSYIPITYLCHYYWSY